MRRHGTKYPPSVTPARLGLTCEPRRPYNLDPYCTLHLTSEKGKLWRDYSGNGNHGTLSGAVFNDQGRCGPAMFFDGSNDAVTLPAAGFTEAYTAFSIELWLNSKTIPGDGNQRAIINHNYAISGSFTIYFPTATTNRTVFRTVNDLAANVSAFNDTIKAVGVWYHVVAVYDGAYQTLYVNGVAGTPVAQTGTFTENAVIKIADTTTDFSGLIDEMRFYRRALSAPEIMALYEQGKP